MDGNSEFHRLNWWICAQGVRAPSQADPLEKLLTEFYFLQKSQLLLEELCQQFFQGNFTNSCYSSWEFCTKIPVTNFSKGSEIVPAAFVPLCTNPVLTVRRSQS